jgi:hypothetical protein
VNYDPDRDTDDWPVIPPEDRWFEDPADPSPSLMRDLPVYPSVPAYAEPLEDTPRRSGWVVLGAAVAVAMLVYFADQAMRGR